jgi:hypothetical protein
MEAQNDMKVKYLFTLLALLALSAGVSAQQDPLDPGAPDSVIIAFTTLPEVGVSSEVAFSVTFAIDEGINGAGGNYGWDFTGLVIDSGIWTPSAESFFTLKYLWANNDIDSTNSKRTFQVTGARLAGGSLSSRLVVVNFYGHVTHWADGDAITISPRTGQRSFTTPALVEFVPIWGGNAVIADVSPIGDGNRPVRYDLAQNYPNPFNPVTKIIFDLPERAKTTLDVFNVLGQKVATLVDAELAAARYEVEWDGSNVASGIYFYRLAADKVVMTKKMMLLK